MKKTTYKQALVASIILLGISACSHVPLAQSDDAALREQLIEIPENFNSQVEVIFQNADAKNWVGQFNSSELQTLVTAGLQGNPNLAATATRVLDSQVVANISQGSRLPNLNANLSAARFKSNTTGQPFIGDNFELGFSSQWEVDLWGKLKDQTKADRLGVKASKQQYKAAELSLSASISKAYFNLLTENELLKLVDQNTKNVEQIEAITIRSFKRGLVNALDVQLARRDLANSKRSLLAQENSAQIAARTLDIILGDYPTGKELTSKQLPALPNAIAYGVPAQVLERRPDLQAAALKMLASELDVASARKTL